MVYTLRSTKIPDQLIMKNISIIVGSQMGSAEYVAEQLQDTLVENNFIVTVHEQPVLANIADTVWLICTSTHGAGELPDNIQAFAADLSQGNTLSNIHYAVIGLGDSSYDQFNQAAKQVDQLLLDKGANQLLDRLEIDAQSEDLPEDIALAWLPQFIATLG